MEYFDEDSESEWSDDNQEVIGLFNNQKFETIKELIKDARDNYNFDFYGFQKKHKLDQYGCIRMINYIRTEIKNKTNPEKLVLNLLPKLLFLNDDKYYKPVLENDAMLFVSFDDNDSNNNDDDDEKYNDKEYRSSSKSNDESLNTRKPNIYESVNRSTSNKIEELSKLFQQDGVAMEQENKALKAMNTELNEKINEMKKTFHRIVLNEEYDDRKKEQFSKNTDNDIDNDDDKKSMTKSNGKSRGKSRSKSNKSEAKNDIDTYYFDSYDRISVHEMMLRDKSRTLSYKDFIMGNSDFFKDKIVMDIGCGTGVLSIFAAKSGAKHVIAIDMSNIAKKAKLIIKNNGLQDKITVIQNKLEDIKNLPNGIKKVDIIISEWMGYFLLYESMLSSVLFARDKWLNRNSSINQIFPNTSSLIMAGFDYDAMELEFWKSCYDIDMSVMYQRPKPISEPLIIDIDPKYIGTQYTTFKVWYIFAFSVECDGIVVIFVFCYIEIGYASNDR